MLGLRNRLLLYDHYHQRTVTPLIFHHANTTASLSILLTRKTSDSNSNMPSPSEFLTFYRCTARLSTLRQSRIVPASPRRTFVSSTCRYSSGGKLSTDDSVANEAYPDSEHATDKKDKLDVQSANAAEGQKYMLFFTLDINHDTDTARL